MKKVVIVQSKDGLKKAIGRLWMGSRSVLGRILTRCQKIDNISHFVAQSLLPKEEQHGC